MQNFILFAKPEFENMEIPKSTSKKYIYYMCESLYFDLFIIFCIFCNILILSMPYDGASKKYLTYLEYFNYCFTLVFLFEMILKLYSFGIKAYFYRSWNIFDFCVVLSSIIDFVLLIFADSKFSFLRKAPQLIKIIRILRIMRVVKLVKKFRGMISLLQSLIYSLPSVLNIGALLFLALFIFSVLGCFLFKNITTGVIINENNNFNNFLNALLILFRCLTGEDWPTIMFDLYHVKG